MYVLAEFLEADFDEDCHNGSLKKPCLHKRKKQAVKPALPTVYDDHMAKELAAA